ISGAFALALGLFIGFDFRPIQMLREAFQFQSAVGQIPWSEVPAIARSAGTKLISMIDFPGGAVRLLLLLVSPFALMPNKRWRSPAPFLCTCLFAWAGLYLVLLAKFAIPWQRHSIPLSAALVVAGAVGIDRVARSARERITPNRRALVRVGAAVGAVLLLAPPAYMSILIAERFAADVTHPLYELSMRLRQEVTSERKPRGFINASLSWNAPPLQVVPIDRFQVEFVPSLEVACAEANEGDFVLDLVFEPLRGSCSLFRLAPVFHSSNLGPPGYPFPADHASAPWAARHYMDFHYL